jgi:hypothetical protein
MVTLKGKQADKFVKKMIKKETSPISKADKKLAEDIKKNMLKLTVEEHKEQRDKERQELEDKYNPTILKKNDGLCARCHKNKGTITYAESILDWNHGFSEFICMECYNKIKHNNTWYKEGFKEGYDKAKEEEKIKCQKRKRNKK